ncbi:sensor histidine kinase [Hymenobacter profundi]|uniref:histidine kinase n=1 Tax=Hymenobacter profundi TaxID=1982110 RepID=A0ABS6WWM7_9BACT|nr:sensor histidine kinase [Hymenobacter profundi]MBW3127183.1 sensor histidine kinase [Hymenobacter profundi]
MSCSKLLVVMGLALASAFPGAAGSLDAPIPAPVTAIDSLRGLLEQRGLPDSTRFRLLGALRDKLFAQADPDARKVGEQAVSLATLRRDWPRASEALYQLIVNCERESDYVGATAYCQQGLDLTKTHKLPDQWRFTQCLGLLAVDTKEAAKGLQWMRLAYQQQAGATKVTPGQRGSLLLNLATTFMVLEQYDSVLHYAARALPPMQQANDARGIGSVYQFKGEVYALLQPHTPARLDSAVTNMRRALPILRQHRFPSHATASALALARTYRLMGRTGESQKAAELALRMARETPMPEYEAEALACLAWAEADQGKVARSTEYDTRSQELRDSLFSHDKAQALARLQVGYDVKLLQQKNRAAEFEQRSQRARLQSLLLLLGGLLATLGVGGWLYWRLRRQKALLAVANEANRQSAAEKEVLLQEIHHRVKNNLQLVSSLLAWQSSVLPDPALTAALAGSQSRIQSMALVHEFLYRADNLAQVRMDDYLAQLLDSLHTSLNSPERPVQLSTDLQPLILEAREATSFGLLVNELVSNAYKHAFRGPGPGHLHVSLSSGPTGFQLRVIDNGVGMAAEGGGEAASRSLGLQLVRRLAKQLKATVTASPSEPTGTRMEVTRS